MASFPVKKLTKVMEVRGVGVCLHWSVLLVGTLILLGAFERPAETLVAWTCYFSVLLIHECGHMVLAQRKGCMVSGIVLYPIAGLCCYRTPWSKYDDAVIAGEEFWRRHSWVFLWLHSLRFLATHDLRR